MKKTIKPLQSSRPWRLAAQGCSILLLSVALPMTAAAKKGGNGGGGGGSGGGGENPVPQLVAAPVDYVETELRWHEDTDPDFGGIFAAWINNQGLAVTWIKRPHPTDVERWGIRVGGINLDLATGETTDTLVDLSEVFGLSVAALNVARTDGPWRIAYGREINDAGLIACQLIPENEPRLFERAVPCLLAVADLSRRGTGNALVLVNAASTDPDQDFWQLNEGGDVLVISPNDFASNIRVFRRDLDASGNPFYTPLETPALGISLNRPSFNSSRNLSFSERVGNAVNSQESFLFQNSLDSGTESLLWRSKDPLFYAVATAEDNTAYAVSFRNVKTGKGKNATTATVSTPYHVISATERTPLTNESAILRWRGSVSHAPVTGEEEVVLELEASGEYQIYKPNFGARFVLPITPGNLLYIGISPPYDPLAVTSPESYSGGYVVYNTTDAIRRAFILTPQPLP